MTEVFRERIAQDKNSESAIIGSDPIELKSDTLQGNENKASDDLSQEEKKLDIWEGLKNKRYIDEIFDTHNTKDEFTIKMPTSEIDKFIRTELEKRGYEKTTENYKRILEEMETEIGSSHLELFKRFTKITGYIRALSKLYKARELRDKYRMTDDED